MTEEPHTQKNRLIIVCGLSFAGKTTIGDAICAEFGHQQVDVDETKVDLHGPRIDDCDLSMEEWTEIYRETDAKIISYLCDGHSVVDASRNFRRAERDEARSIAYGMKTITVVVYVDTPESLVRQRWLENKSIQLRRDVKSEAFNEIIAVKEPPSADEKAIIFHHDDDIKSWIAENAEYLAGQ
jgi:predicted kinase